MSRRATIELRNGEQVILDMADIRNGMLNQQGETLPLDDDSVEVCIAQQNGARIISIPIAKISQIYNLNPPFSFHAEGGGAIGQPTSLLVVTGFDDQKESRRILLEEVHTVTFADLPHSP